jgi:ammonia channel protein AmtB
MKGQRWRWFSMVPRSHREFSLLLSGIIIGLAAATETLPYLRFWASVVLGMPDTR